jgi:hypothetical protein
VNQSKTHLRDSIMFLEHISCQLGANNSLSINARCLKDNDASNSGVSSEKTSAGS